MPDHLEAVTAAALPTPGGAALDLVESLGPLKGKTVASRRLAPPPITAVKLGDLPAAWQRGRPDVKTVVIP